MTTVLYALAGSLAICAIYLIAAWAEDRAREKRYAENWRQRRIDEWTKR